MKSIIVSLFLCILSTNNVSPTKSDTLFSVKIRVESKTHQPIIKSHLRRELRHLGDIRVVEDKREYELSVIHIHESRTQSNFFSIVVTCYLGSLNHDFANACLVRHHELLTFNHNIKEGCAEIVASVDDAVFEPLRAILVQFQ